jgi:hypothetical protein
MSKPGKLIMTWDIAPQHEREYFEFVVREFLPGMQKFGFELSDAWVTVYGHHPQILVGVTLPSAQEIRKVQQSDEWQALFNQLSEHVVNFKQKIVKAEGGFQF